MKEEYDVSFSIDKKKYKGKVTMQNVNKNLKEHDKIDSVKKQSESLAKKISPNEIENLIIKKTMNKIITILIIFVLANINTMFAQNTTLVVDNQNPGWLSNKIPFKDQESVKNLTVTGYLNGTDIKFIRELLSNRQLTHLDLSDANIVAGGDAYYSSNTTKDNEIGSSMFKLPSPNDKKVFDYLSLPKSIEKISGIFYNSLDTLIVGGNIKILPMDYLHYNIKYLYVREGVDSIKPYIENIEQFEKIKLPKTLTNLGKKTFYCKNNLDINIDWLSFMDHEAIYNTYLNTDTIHLSKNLKYWHVCSFNIKQGSVIYLPKSVKTIDISCLYGSGLHYGTDNTFTGNLIIHAENEVPTRIICRNDANENVGYKLLSRATVYVPKGCSEAYKKKNYVGSENNPWSYATILEEKVPVTGIILDQENISFSDIGASVQLTATILPTNADNKNVTWKSSDTSVATVVDGKVTCTGYGTAQITATSEEGAFVATCNVTATKRIVLPSSITLDKQESTIKVGETTTLKVNVLPIDADDKTVSWSSEDSEIASVTNEGVVTGHKAGTVKIIATTNANGLKAECTVTVLQPVTGITIDKQNISLSEIGESVQLTASVLPEDASNKNVTWSSSDNKVAIVSNGKVVCTGYGTAVISVVTEDGGYMATCVINVTSGINGIYEDKDYQDSKRYDATGREINNPVNGINIIKTKDGRTIKTNVH